MSCVRPELDPDPSDAADLREIRRDRRIAWAMGGLLALYVGWRVFG